MIREKKYYINEIGKLSDERARDLGKILLTFSSQEDLTVNNLIEHAYDYLSIFQNINFILPDDIIATLKIKASYYAYNETSTKGYIEVYEQLIYEFVKKFNEDIDFKTEIQNQYQKELQYIYKIFSNANIFEVIAKQNTNGENLRVCFEIKSVDSDTSFEKFFEEYTLFNYQELQNLLESTERIETVGSEMNLLGIGFFYYKIRNYSNSYQLLKVVSNISKRENQYLTFAVSQLDKLLLHTTMKNTFGSELKNQVLLDEVENEVHNIDINNIFSNIPNSQKQIIPFFNGIAQFSFLHKYRSKLYIELERQKKSKKILENGGWSTDLPKVNQSYLYIFNLFNFINKNFLFVDNFLDLNSVYDIFFETVLINYKLEITKRSYFLSHNGSIEKTEDLDYFVIFLMITAGNYEKLLDLFQENKIEELEVTVECRSNIFIALRNLINNINYEDNYYVIRNYLNKTLLIVSRLNLLNKEEFISIIDTFVSLINIYGIKDKYFLFNDFIARNYNKNKSIVDIEALIKFFKIYLTHNINSTNLRLESEEENLIKDIVYILEENSFLFEHDIIVVKSIVSKINSLLASSEVEPALEIALKFLYNLYPIMDDEYKEVSKQIIFKILSEYSPHEENYINFLTLFYHTTAKEIIVLNKDLIDKYFSLIKEIFQLYDGKNIYPDFIKFSFEQLALLVIFNKISPEMVKNEIPDLINSNDFLKFALSPENFNYDSFDINWLVFFPDEFNKSLIENIIIKKKLANLFKKRIEIINDLRYSNLKNIYLKYFS